MGHVEVTSAFLCVVVQPLSHVSLGPPWFAARQASLSFSICWNLFKLISFESVMLSNHHILCLALLLLPSNFPSFRVFSNESALHTWWPKYWSFSISPSSDFKHQVLQDWFPYRRKHNIHEGSLLPQEEDEFRENKTWKGWLFWLWKDTFGIVQN